VAFLADEGGETIWVTDSDHCAAKHG
jgi:hypothetical protein